MVSTVFFTLLVLSCMLLASNAQFFFPFGMGAQNSAPAYNNYGATYGNGYGVKASEGFFALCKGWTCQN